MKKLVSILLFVIVCALGVNAQGYQKFWGGSSDTLNADDTIEKVFNVREKANQQVTVQISADSLSGTAGATATLYESLDGVNFITTGSAVTWSTGVDTTFILTDNTFNGAYAKVKIVANSTTQNQSVSAAIKWSDR